MSATKRPSSVAAMRRAVAATPPAALPEEDPAEKYGFGRNAAPPVAYAPPRPEKPVRFTLDLDRDRHRFLKDYAVQTETDASVVLRALIDQLRNDPGLAARVQAHIWQRP